MGEWANYFKSRHAAEAAIPPEPITREKPCGDCAVIRGMYREISDELLKQPEPVRTEFSERWFCHNGGRCMGHWLRLREVLPDEGAERRG